MSTTAEERKHDLLFVQHRGRWYVSVPDLTAMLEDFALQAHNRARAQEARTLRAVVNSVHAALAKGIAA